MSNPPSGLFPIPRELELTGEAPPSDVAPGFALDRDLPDQGYELRADAEGIRIAYADTAGRRYAEQTLECLARAHPAGLPGLRVRDWPDFPVRGYLLDVSRDRVPTRETLEGLVTRLARLRLNHLELYTEHSFAYRDHETVWRDASPLTPADVRWLDDRCLAHGIELVANQNCFGHMERWLRHPEYRDRAEAPDGWEIPGIGRRRASVLAPSPANAAFALGLVRELMQCFTSRRVNIGCDETFELGMGKSRADVAKRGRGRVYLEHLLRLLDGLHADGREVLFWGDILRNHPELVSELPREDTIALVWHYEAPMDAAVFPPSVVQLMDRFGITPDSLRGFGSQVRAFAEHDVPFWVCPGTSSWNSLIGRLPNARANLLDAAEVGLARGAGGFLVTDWGDNGHLQPPSVSLPPLVYGAGLAWNLAAHRDVELAPILDDVVFEDEARELGSALVEMGEAGAETGLRAFNASPLHSELIPGSALGSIGEPDAGRIAAVVERLAATDAKLARARPSCDDGQLAVRELRQALRLARQGAWRTLGRAGGAAPDDAELRRDLAEAIEEQRACWLERSRPGGLADSLARLEAALDAKS